MDIPPNEDLVPNDACNTQNMSLATDCDLITLDFGAQIGTTIPNAKDDLVINDDVIQNKDLNKSEELSSKVEEVLLNLQTSTKLSSQKIRPFSNGLKAKSSDIDIHTAISDDEDDLIEMDKRTFTHDDAFNIKIKINMDKPYKFMPTPTMRLLEDQIKACAYAFSTSIDPSKELVVTDTIRATISNFDHFLPNRPITDKILELVALRCTDDQFDVSFKTTWQHPPEFVPEDHDIRMITAVHLLRSRINQKKSRIIVSTNEFWNMHTNHEMFCLPFISDLFQFASVLLLGFITADHCSVMKSSSPFNLLRQFLLHRHLRFTLAPPQHRAWCTAATPAINPYHLWKEKEEEILRDIEPVVTLTKDILHSRRNVNVNVLQLQQQNAESVWAVLGLADEPAVQPCSEVKKNGVSPRTAATLIPGPAVVTLGWRGSQLKLQVVTPIMFIVVSDLAAVVNALLLVPVVVLANQQPENPEPSETELKRADLFFNYAYALVASRAKLDDFTIEVQVGTSSAGCG
ncbi:uncharacterized protein DS421_14g457350 [Arachis hypogaea]|nr:uncharacterized protein DS421_14g457350 [Arachis hypogaea]